MRLGWGRSGAPVDIPAATRASVTPTKWRVPVRFDGQSTTIGVIPDLVFELAFDDGKRSAFLVEIDRGTMPIARSRLEQPSLLRKFLAYHHGHQQRLHDKHYGWKNFRQLTVTNTRQRADNIRAFLAGHRQLAASQLFLVTDKPALDMTPDLFLHPRQASDNASRRLVMDEYLVSTPRR